MAVKFIIKEKVPKELWIVDDKLGVVPLEIKILSSLNHPNVVRYLDHMIEDSYILLITELHGTEWDPNNSRLNAVSNPGLRSAPAPKPAVDNSESSPLFRLTAEQQSELASRRRTSCDLFECIDARMFPQTLWNW